MGDHISGHNSVLTACNSFINLLLHTCLYSRLSRFLYSTSLCVDRPSFLPRAFPLVFCHASHSRLFIGVLHGLRARPPRRAQKITPRSRCSDHWSRSFGLRVGGGARKSRSQCHTP